MNQANQSGQRSDAQATPMTTLTRSDAAHHGEDQIILIIGDKAFHLGGDRVFETKVEWVGMDRAELGTTWVSRGLPLAPGEMARLALVKAALNTAEASQL